MACKKVSQSYGNIEASQHDMMKKDVVEDATSFLGRVSGSRPINVELLLFSGRCG